MSIMRLMASDRDAMPFALAHPHQARLIEDSSRPSRAASAALSFST
jgi:hypothetical protein